MKLLKTSVLLASALCIAACSAPTTENKSSVQSTQSTTKKSDESATSSTTTTTKSETTTSTTVATTTQQTTVAASRKIDFAAIANGDLSSIWGTYPASSGVFTIKDNKTIILENSGDRKVMHIETVNQYQGLTVFGADIVEINGIAQPKDSKYQVGQSLFPFYIVPAGKTAPEVTTEEQDISRPRVVTYLNFFYLD